MKKDKIQAIRDEERKDYKVISKKDRLIAQCDHKKQVKGEEIATLKPIGDGSKARCSICGTIVQIDPMSIGDIKEAVNVIIDALNDIKVGAEALPEATLAELGDMILNIKQVPTWYEKQYLETIAVDTRRNTTRSVGNGPLQLNSELGQNRGFHVSNVYDNHDKKKKHGGKHGKNDYGKGNRNGKKYEKHRSIQDLASRNY